MVRSTAIMTRIGYLRQDAGEPLLLPIDDNPILDLLKRPPRVTAPPLTTAADLVRQRGADDHRGILFESREWSWRQVVAECEIRAALLTELRQDGPFHVGVLLENIPEYIFLLGGAALAGAVVVGINPTRRGAELAEDIARTDCQMVITDSTQQHLVDHLDLGLDPDRTMVIDTRGVPKAARRRRRPDGTGAGDRRRTTSTSCCSPRGRPVVPRPSA